MRLPSFDLQREIAERTDQDWLFGALSQPGIVSIPEAERAAYLPKGETQFGTFADFSDCASRSPVNHLESLFTYHYRHSMKPDNKQWLLDNGYVVMRDGLAWIEFSDRFVAVGSKTTRAGNSLKAPIDYIHNNGLVPKSTLPKRDDMTWDQYHDPAAITPAMLSLGKQFKERFTINYENVSRLLFGEALKDDMIGVAGYAWPKPVNGVYPRTDNEPSHAFLLYSVPAFQAYDNYFDFTDDGTQVPGDFTKNLAPDYKFWDWGYRVYVSAEHLPADDSHATALWGWLARMLAWIRGGQQEAMPSIPIEILPTVPPTEPLQPKYRWNTPDDARHSARVIMDEYGLSWDDKNLLCACIMQESGFKPRVIGKPNKNGTTDFGLCQYNDGRNPKTGQAYWIGSGADFADIDEVLDDPEKNVRVMVREFKKGNLKLWASYSTGAYRKYL